MPPAPRKPCRTPGCGKLAKTSYCEEHTRKQEASKKIERIKYDNERGTSSSRGYNSRWNRYSKHYRIDNPFCVMCKPKLTLAQCVDHIKPVSGPDDPLFWDESNHQSLCHNCHSIKTAEEDGGFGNKLKERFI